MFTSVIGTLTSLLPKYFIFGAYVPVLIFGFINFTLTFFYAAWFRNAIGYALKTWPGLTVAVAFVATVVVAYVVSAINDFPREFLEGRHLWPRGLAKGLRARQRRRRKKLVRKYRYARDARFVLARRVAEWQQSLRLAGIRGSNAHRGRVAFDPRNDPAAQAIKALPFIIKPRHLEETTSRIETAVAAMKCALWNNDRTVDASLDSARVWLEQYVDTALNVASQAEFKTATKLYWSFGAGPVKPTRMGNVAAAIQSYAVGRYKIDLTIFLSRLQAVLIRSGDKGYPIVLDAKAQLDFLVACCCFSGLTAVIWLIAFAAEGTDWISYIGLAIVGPLVTRALYYLTAESYLSYAECLRACLDINRFSLLRATDIELPGSLREERALWSTLSRLTFSGGGEIELSYRHGLASAAAAAPASDTSSSAATPRRDGG
jgi:hypothetical protein